MTLPPPEAKDNAAHHEPRSVGISTPLSQAAEAGVRTEPATLRSGTAAPSPETAYRAAVDGLNKATDAQLAPAAPFPETAVREPSTKEQSNFDDDTQRDFLNREALVPETSGDYSGLIEDLRAGVQPTGGFEDGVELFNVEGASDLMGQAADALASLSASHVSAAPSSDALEELAGRLETLNPARLGALDFAPNEAHFAAVAIRAAIRRLKAYDYREEEDYPNARPSADGGKGGTG